MLVGMSTIDLALQRVARLDERYAAKLLVWLDGQLAVEKVKTTAAPLGAHAMIGFAQREGRASQTTDQWMKELRAGDSD